MTYGTVSGTTPGEGFSGVGDGDGDLPSLADTIAAVRRELSSAQAASLGQPVQFRTGSVELDFEVAVTRTGGGSAGVRVGVLTLDGKGMPAVAGTQRIKVRLQPLDPKAYGDARVSEVRRGLGVVTSEALDGGVPPERPVRAEGLEVHEVDDGLVVYQSQPECVHHLNNTAAIVFELCDGENTAPEISGQLAGAFGLAQVPDLLAESCIADLWSKGVIV
jgi:hypothetical protein